MARRQGEANPEPKEQPQLEHVPSPECWCEPILDYVAEDGSRVWVHRQLCQDPVTEAFLRLSPESEVVAYLCALFRLAAPYAAPQAVSRAYLEASAVHRSRFGN